MRIEGLSQPPKTQQSGQRGEGVRQKKDSGRAGDVVEISKGPEAADLTALAKAVPEELGARVQEIRARVQSGYYNSEEVREKIAGALLDADSIRPVAEEVAEVRTVRRQLDSVPDVRSERVAETRERAASGYYDQTQIRRETADSIIDASA